MLKMLVENRFKHLEAPSRRWSRGSEVTVMKGEGRWGVETKGHDSISTDFEQRRLRKGRWNGE